MNPNKRKGLQYEELARDYLLNQGLTLHLQNFQCRFGEIDLIMLDGDIICFVEVKYRKNSAFGGAISAISTTKKKKIIITAQFFISKNSGLAHNAMRFDAILLQHSPAQEPVKINWIQNAFYAE